MKNIKYPFGAADVQTPAFASTIDVTASNNLTLVKPETLTGAVTLNVIPGDGLEVGAELHLQVTTDGTEVLTFGTGATAPAVTGVAGKTWCQSLIYNGSVFVPKGAKIQID